MRHRISAVLLALPLVACGVEAPDAESTERADAPHALGVTACSTPLANGVKVTGISAEANAWSCTYALEVPAGAGKLAFDMVRSASGRGSAFMYVRFGAEPTTTTSDCNPGRVTDANCTFLRPRAGTWYVKIGGFSSPASGLELTGAYTLGIPGDSVLANGVETARYLYKGGVWKCFTLDVPGGMRSVVFNERLTRHHPQRGLNRTTNVSADMSVDTSTRPLARAGRGRPAPGASPHPARRVEKPRSPLGYTPTLAALPSGARQGLSSPCSFPASLLPG